MPLIRNLANQKFGMLTAISYSHSEKGKACWFCLCDCGNKHTVVRGSLVNGLTKSCGCLGTNTKHGKTHTNEFDIWSGMRGRCRNENNKMFKDYGGRGIKVCKKWDDSFISFFDDMGERPSVEHSIERIDNDGDYTPENCKWATAKEQSNNRRSNRFFVIGDAKKTLSQWCDIYNIRYGTVNMRINSYGYSIYKALTKPVRGAR